MSGVICGVTATIIYYAYTGNISSFFLGLIANLAGLLLMELFLRMTTNNKDITPATEQEK
jgi:uncharacterized membrane protein YeaQ/YmgE (transglycosylase-associated protein family)